MSGVSTTPPTKTDATMTTAEIVAALQADIAQLKAANELLTKQRDEYRRHYLDMMALVRKLELGIMGRGRERDLGEGGTLSLLALMGGVEQPPAPPAPETSKVAEHERKKASPPGRQHLPENLPRVEIELIPDEVQRAGLDQFERIGQDECETLERRAASLVVVRTIRPKFVPRGQERGAETNVQQASPPDLPIERGLAGPGMLADTIVRRAADHTPLHRMERIYARDGIKLTRQTICGWHMALAEDFKPLIMAMWKDALTAPYLCIDATGVLVQNAEKCRNGHFFVVAAPEKCVLFGFSEKHNSKAVDELVGDYEGFLVADAHTVYDHLYQLGSMRESGCWAHARRYFFKALGSEPQRARVALAFFKQLFDHERSIKNVAADERLRLREKLHAPVVEAFEQWCDAESLKVLDESPLAKAIGYARNQRTALRTPLTDGRLPLDNNWSERELRRIAWGRDNWLFVGSEDGGHTMATLVSLIASCQLHGIEPLAYLRDMLCLYPSWPQTKVLELSPLHWRTTSARDDVRARLAVNPFRRAALGELPEKPRS